MGKNQSENKTTKMSCIGPVRKKRPKTKVASRKIIRAEGGLHTRPFLRGAVSKTDEKWDEGQTYTPLTSLEYKCKLQLFRDINKGKTKGKQRKRLNRSKTDEKWTYTPLTTLEYKCKLQPF